LAVVIAAHLQRFDQKQKILITGGGAHNKFMLELISAYLNELDHEICESASELIDFKEAALMGLMAFLFVSGKNNVLNSATGSRISHIGGCFHQAPGQSKRIYG
jgi:anhydro-N-acetylmuramic acid kinase